MSREGDLVHSSSNHACSTSRHAWATFCCVERPEKILRKTQLTKLTRADRWTSTPPSGPKVMPGVAAEEIFALGISWTNLTSYTTDRIW